VTGTSLEYLGGASIGETDQFDRRAWTHSEVFVPYGSPSFVPAVSAIFSGRGRLLGTDVIRDFDLYIGARGD
jgi:hypothetical protein